MKVILLEELRGRGVEGDVIEVANGFAVNYLLPRRIAVEATSSNLKQLEDRKKVIAAREAERVAAAEQAKAAIEGKTVEITVVAQEGGGNIFGSVTTAMIADALSEQHGITIDRKRIETRGAIRTVGEHKISASLYRDIQATFTVRIVAEGEEN